MLSDIVHSNIDTLSQAHYGIVITAALVVVSVALLLAALVPRRPPKTPPGPPCRLPFIGNLLELQRSPDTRENLKRLRREYGEIYSLQMGKRLVIILSGYDIIRDTLVKRADVFSGRPNGFARDVLMKNKGIAATSGHLWKEHRKFALQTLRDFGFGKSVMEVKIHEEVKYFLAEIEKRESMPFNMEMLINISVSNIISSLAFGGSFKHGDPKFQDLLNKLNQLINILGFNGVLNFMPYLSHLPGDIFKAHEAQRLHGDIMTFLRSVIQDHFENYDEDAANDYTSAFIKEMKAQETQDSTSFNVEQLASTLFDLFVAGSETTTTTLRWAVIYLVNYPEMQEKIWAEIEENVGENNLPSLGDRRKCNYTEAFIMETLRHACIVTIGVPHSVSDDVEVNGYRIPKDTIILPDLYSSLHDPMSWESPENFQPERFLNSEGEMVKTDQFIPFSTGRRQCLGESLSRMELFLFLSSMVQRFQFRAPENENLGIEAVDGVFGAAHKPKSYNIVAVARN